VVELDADTSAGRQYRVLIADDDKASRVLVRTMLADLGPKLTTLEVSCGQAALAAVDAYHPDLILLDILMPDVDGISICTELRKRPETRNTRILMVTARRDERMIRAGLLAGADDYLTKPFSKEQLLDHVRRLLPPEAPTKPA
jgi:CheY-like chemotaxis protein